MRGVLGIFGRFELVVDQNYRHLSQLLGKIRSLFRELERFFVLIKLRQDGTQLQNESTVMPRHVNCSLERVSAWSSLRTRVFVDVEPQLYRDCFSFLNLFLLILLSD